MLTDCWRPFLHVSITHSCSSPDPLSFKRSTSCHVWHQTVKKKTSKEGGIWLARQTSVAEGSEEREPVSRTWTWALHITAPVWHLSPDLSSFLQKKKNFFVLFFVKHNQHMCPILLYEHSSIIYTRFFQGHWGSPVPISSSHSTNWATVPLYEHFIT